MRKKKKEIARQSVRATMLQMRHTIQTDQSSWSRTQKYAEPSKEKHLLWQDNYCDVCRCVTLQLERRTNSNPSNCRTARLECLTCRNEKFIGMDWDRTRTGIRRLRAKRSSRR